MFPISDSDLRTSGRPYVNVTIIAACALVFIYELIIGGLNQSILFYKFGLIPTELSHGFDFSVLQTQSGTHDIATPIPNWATMFTSMFLHGGWMHFGANMLFLWVFGRSIENRFGHFRYLLFYLAAGLAAAWLQIAIDTNSETPTIGASGAIAGVLGAYLLLYPFSRIRTIIFFFFITMVRIPAVLLLGFWFLLQFFSGIGSLGLSTQGGGVAYWAHIGGFLFGLAVVVVYKLVKKERIWPGSSGGPGGFDGGPPQEYEVPQYWRGRPL